MRKINSVKNVALLVAAWLVMTAALFPCSAGYSRSVQNPSSPTAAPGDPPALNGATLLDTRCAICHSADKPKQAKKTHEQWELTVTHMINNGARLNAAEKKVLVDYLARTYGP